MLGLVIAVAVSLFVSDRVMGITSTVVGNESTALVVFWNGAACLYWLSTVSLVLIRQAYGELTICEAYLAATDQPQ